MAHLPYFVQECPTCGRRLEIRVVYLGKQVYCQHCGARFLACQSTSLEGGSPPAEALLRRADRLIDGGATIWFNR